MLLKRGIACLLFMLVLFAYFLCYLWVKVACLLFNAFFLLTNYKAIAICQICLHSHSLPTTFESQIQYIKIMEKKNEKQQTEYLKQAIFRRN